MSSVYYDLLSQWPFLHVHMCWCDTSIISQRLNLIVYHHCALQQIAIGTPLLLTFIFPIIHMCISSDVLSPSIMNLCLDPWQTIGNKEHKELCIQVQKCKVKGQVRPVVNILGNPWVSFPTFANPYPYPSKPVPTLMGMGLNRSGSQVWWVLRVDAGLVVWGGWVCGLQVKKTCMGLRVATL